jgi:hypothetical protein
MNKRINNIGLFKGRGCRAAGQTAVICGNLVTSTEKPKIMSMTFAAHDKFFMEEADEEISLKELSDEEILMAFFRDGCDLDGTPMLMPGSHEGSVFSSNRNVLLH